MPVAHHAAGQQRVGRQRRDPVADLVAGDPCPGPRDLVGDARVPPDVERVHDDADLARPGTARRCRAPAPAWRSPRGRRRRSGAWARCRGVTPARAAYGTSAADGLGRPVAGAAQVAVAVRQPAGHQHQRRRPERRGLLDAPRRLLASAASIAVGSAAVKKPPRHSDETRRPASVTSRGGLVQADLGDGSRQTPDRGQPGVDAAWTASGSDQVAVVRWLSDSRASRGSRVRHRATPARRQSRSPQPRAAASSGSASRPRLVGQLETRARCTNDASRLQAADHREAGLVAVQPGQERDPGLVVVRRRGEEVAGQRHGRGHLARRTPRRRRRRARCRAAEAAGAIAAKMPSSASEWCSRRPRSAPGS